jgi:transcriptional antiterminator RfaH
MSVWCAAFTRPRQEDVARENLLRQGFRTYLPKLKQPKRRRGRWVEAVEPLFPRYLFVELDFGAHDISPIRSTRGVVSLVRFGPQPAMAPKGFVESLMAAEDPTSACHLAGLDPFRKGDPVIIASGPLAGTRAIFEEPTGQGRVTLLLHLLGRTNSVQVDRNQVVCAA